MFCRCWTWSWRFQAGRCLDLDWSVLFTLKAFNWPGRSCSKQRALNMLNIVLRSRVSKWGWELLCLQAWAVSSTWIIRFLITSFNNLFLWLCHRILSLCPDMGRACELFLALRTLPLAAKHEGRFHFQCQKGSTKWQETGHQLHSYLVDLISTRCLPLPQEEGQQWPLLLLLPALVLIIFNLRCNLAVNSC